MGEEKRCDAVEIDMASFSDFRCHIDAGDEVCEELLAGD